MDDLILLIEELPVNNFHLQMKMKTVGLSQMEETVN